MKLGLKSQFFYIRGSRFSINHKSYIINLKFFGMLRISANILLFASVLFFPWWMTVASGITFAVFFRAPYEVIFWAFLSDLLYGTEMSSFPRITFLLTASATVLVLVLEKIKKMTRFY